MSVGLGVALPESWTWSALKFATTFLNRGTAPVYVDRGPVRAISQAANQAAGLDWSRTRFHEYLGNPRLLRGHLISDDVLINSTGKGTLGRIGYFTSGPDMLPCIADGHVTVARADRAVSHPRFMYYWLTSTTFQDYIFSALTLGATNQIELSRERLAASPMALPPLDEQHRIVDFLDVEVGLLDHLVGRRNRQLEVLDELTLATIDDAIGPVRKFAAMRLGYLALVQSGVTVDGSRPAAENVVTLPYLRVANVQVGRVDLLDVSEITLPRSVAAASRLRVGDVLMTEGGDLDKLGRGTVWNGEIDHCLHQNHVFAVRADPNVLCSEYLALITRTSMARDYFERTGNKTTNLASTSSSKIRDFRIPMADLDGQRAIVHEVEMRLRWISEFRERLCEQLARLAERRQALITAAVTGQIDVSTARGIET